MVQKFDVGKKVTEAGVILGGLGVIGFLGLIWLMIYGNLSGNLGFGQDSLGVDNVPFNLTDTGAIPEGAGIAGRVNEGLSSIIMVNATTGETIEAGNFTVSGVTITVATDTYNNTNLTYQSNVNVSFTVSFDEQGKIDTENVITNITGGFLTFFGFSNTFFTIAAIILLIFMLLGLLALAILIMRMQQGKGGGKGGFAG